MATIWSLKEGLPSKGPRWPSNLFSGALMSSGFIVIFAYQQHYERDPRRRLIQEVTWRRYG